MAATREDVDRWIKTAKEKGATHIISVCDTFDWDDYPVYVMPGENIEERKSEYVHRTTNGLLTIQRVVRF